jgi:hypothetical protein
MIRCDNCKRIFSEDDLIIVQDDPSPSGISLPAGAYSYAYCPHCGESIGSSNEFALIDNLDIEEAVDGSVEVTFEGRGLRFWMDEDGSLQWEEYRAPKLEKRKEAKSHDAA